MNKFMIVPNSVSPEGKKEYDEKDYKENILPKLLKHIEDDQFGSLNNPGVPVTLIYGAHIRNEQ